MTDLYNGKITDLLQNDSEYNVKVQALAYALALEKKRIMDEADKTRTLAMIEDLPEKILDVLAVELRSPYYTEDMTIEQKRDVITNSLVWYYRAGTPAAVSEMAAAVFGSGQVVEWFDFDPNDGEIIPGEFDIETGAEIQDPQQFMPVIQRIISRVKNTRSHLRSVRFLRIIHTPETPKILPQHYTVKTITNVLNETKSTTLPVRAAVFLQTIPAATITNVIKETISPTPPVRAAAFLQTIPTVTIR